MNDHVTIDDNDVLIVVDVQNDFCPDGALAVPRGDEVVPAINRVAGKFRKVVLTQDWHPGGHLSFASSHPVFCFVPPRQKSLRNRHDALRPQVLRPDRCVQETPGAAFHRDLRIPHAGLVLRKGMNRAFDSYSVFYENDRTTPTGLAGYLRTRGIARVFLAGLAFDFCVRYSAEDARRENYTAFIIEDACRGIDLAGSVAATRQSFASLGVPCIAQP